MDFELSDDQRALREGAAALLDGRATPARVREVADGEDHVDRTLWSAMAEQGWQALLTPIESGGLGLGAVELSVLCEELGRHLAPVPFIGTLVALGALARSAAAGEVPCDAPLGDIDVASSMARLGSGAAVGALAWSGADDALVAVADGDRWRITGRTDPVVWGPSADVVVSCAATDSGPALFALAPGTRPSAEPAMDRTRSLGWLELHDEPALRLGGEGSVESVIDRAATALSAEMLGAADQVLAATVQYAKDRVQFGRPIGSFQAVKHRCADMLVDVEGMRSVAYYAAWAVGAGDPDASAAASAAKVWCSDASRRVMASALQVHGGIGFTWEHDLHLFLKRSQLDQLSYGDARYHRERLVRILRPRAEAGLPVL
ncbi:MAG: acyl-CoA dehydrogenase family protein [Acidimicrobiales bacterium]